MSIEGYVTSKIWMKTDLIEVSARVLSRSYENRKVVSAMFKMAEDVESLLRLNITWVERYALARLLISSCCYAGIYRCVTEDDSDERSPHGGYRCAIYENRPLACRAYPVIESRKEIKLDDKCQFCKSCSGSIEGIQDEIEALTNIQQIVRSDEEDIWRYATGVCEEKDKDFVRVGWIL